MKKICCFLALVLLLGCLAGCQSGEHQERSIENADGTLSDWMKDEIYEAFAKDYFEEYGATPTKAQFGSWWDSQKPMQGAINRYYGTYDGYVMFSQDTGMTACQDKTIAGFHFQFPNIYILTAYKDGELYDLEELLSQGLIDEKAIKIAYDAHRRIIEITREYKDQKNK